MTSRAERLAAYGAVSTSLALRGDRELADLLATATPLGTGIGGSSALLDIDGTPVFAKRVPLTELERHPDHARSTANLFGVPLFCHYGLPEPFGGPGFGTWREVAVHTMTTNWVLTAEHEGFPLTYHWRVLPEAEPAPLPDALADLDAAVAFWGGGPEVRHRIEALRDAPASVVLFLEYIPHTLHDWLDERLREGGEAADRACTMVEAELEAGVAFMNARGLLHFDTHFQNVLTDGRRLYFADYGLAISNRFALSPAEAAFHARHGTYDRAYTANHLVHWLLFAAHSYDRDAREAAVRAVAEGERPTGLPPAATEIVMRHAPVAATMTAFRRALQDDTRLTPYPAAAFSQVTA